MAFSLRRFGRIRLRIRKGATCERPHVEGKKLLGVPLEEPYSEYDSSHSSTSCGIRQKG